MTDPLVQRYLDHVRFEKRLAERTVTLYTLDLDKLAGHAAEAGVGLTAVQPTHIRRWAAQMHSGGRSGRGIALILSGWRGFYAWLGHEGLVGVNPVLHVRAPKAAKPLPKALNVDDAVQLASFQNESANPWLEARDAAIVELLYGGGLRLAEVTGLDVQASERARGWLDLQAGEAHVLGKGSKRRIVPVGAQAVAAVQRWLLVRDQGLPGWSSSPSAGQALEGALFIGRHGTRLSACKLRDCSRAVCRPGWPCRFTHTCCAIRLPAMCCSPAATCVGCRSCWAMPTSAPRRFTPGWTLAT